MSDEKRWTLHADPDRGAWWEGPDIEPGIEVIPAEAAESKLAEVGEARAFDRAADALASPVQEQPDNCPSSGDGGHAFEDHGGGAIRCMDCGKAQEQPRYTVERIRERLLSREAIEAAAEVPVPTSRPEELTAAAESLGAALDAAFPQPNTPTEGDGQ